MARAASALVLPGLVVAALSLASNALAQAPAPAPAPSPSALGAAPPPPPGAAPQAAPPAPPAPAPAAAQPAPAPAPVPAPVAAAATPAPAEPPPIPPKTARPPASGFQFAFRTGALFPFGDASDEGNDALGSRYAWQFPVVIDLGARFAESFFAGAYFGIGFGSTGSDTRLDAACTDDDDDGTNDITCNVVSLRAGFEGSYSFQPGETMNPWIGYGIGYEVTDATYTDHERGYRESVSSGGVTWAQLTFGLDFRKAVGVGPFLEVAIGEFNKTTTEIGDAKFRTPIRDKALHAWIMPGLRFVVNP